jgi:hypothetical protein
MINYHSFAMAPSSARTPPRAFRWRLQECEPEREGPLAVDCACACAAALGTHVLTAVKSACVAGVPALEWRSRPGPPERIQAALALGASRSSTLEAAPCAARGLLSQRCCSWTSRPPASGRVLIMEEAVVVRRRVLVDHQSIRRVAREMGISRNAVRRYVRGAPPSVGKPQGCAGRSGARAGSSSRPGAAPGVGALDAGTSHRAHRYSGPVGRDGARVEGTRGSLGRCPQSWPRASSAPNNDPSAVSS